MHLSDVFFYLHLKYTFGAVLSLSGRKLLEKDQNEILIQCRPKRIDVGLTLACGKNTDLRTKDVIPKLSVRLAI